MILEDIIYHCRKEEFMGGIDRDTSRIKKTAEVFTPTNLVNKMLDELPPELFSDPSKKFLDNSCGDGQFLSEILIRKIENNIEFDVALSSIYGIDLMPDNVDLCRNRLLCNQEHLRHIVESNIVCADSLTYHYKFNNIPIEQPTNLDNFNGEDI